MRLIAVDLMKQETTLKRGIQGKRLKPGWREKYLVKVLLGSDAMALRAEGEPCHGEGQHNIIAVI